ncbi:MurR/RpiR family transcriptional regulator [Clostridium manihotivorum]|uniref:Transcriptional regulator n=1 Tax=Clostridium manihotivorum TaxID=2320868 RepID=A0A3R5U3F3_9CLOT|nr:MurR/RpiR family transcriptional regulator [Clostridium manihotivorum]QAA30580.1 transcriptional regulator [Clostridium manihotivorum]
MFSAENLANLSELELELYKYVIENINKVIYMRIRELAQETHVSTTTIIRFCRNLGCDGFSDFKVKLKMHAKESNTKSVDDNIDAIEEFMERSLKGDLDENIIKAAELIVNYNNVLFIGIGNSGFIAGYGARYMSSLGKFAVHIDDPYFPLIGDLVNNSVTIALSVSGETDAALRLISLLKSKGSKIVSITNKKSSTLSKLSDVSISYYITTESYLDNDLEYRDTTSQVPALYIVEALAREVNRMIV